MSKYENSVFPYSVHSTVKLPAWRPKDANITLLFFLPFFTQTITPERKVFFSKLHDNVTCQCCQS